MNDKIAYELLQSIGADKKKSSLIASSYDNIVVRSGDTILRWSLNKTMDDVNSEADLLRFLYKNNVKTAHLVDVSSTIVQGKTYPLMVSTFVPHDTNPQLSDHITCQAAKELRAIHTVGELYCRRKHYPQRRTMEESLIRLDSLLKNGLSPKAINRGEVVRDVEWAISFLRGASQLAGPLTILHNDFRPQNVLMSDNSVAAVIDFDYSVSSVFPQKDVAHAALEWSFPDTADSPDDIILKAFVEAYAAENNETYKEYIQRVRLVDWIKVSALIDAAGYWMHNQEKTTAKFKSHMYAKYNYFKGSSDV